jgi:hypothetical protein
MWRKLLARAHPDSGGDHELYIWAANLREVVQERGGRSHHYTPPPPPPRPPRPEPEPDCIPFEDVLGMPFDLLTQCAIGMADDLPPLYGNLLRLLEDCGEVCSGPLGRQQDRGASYKQLAAIGYAVGMSKTQRGRWYRTAEKVPLSMRHAGHILSKLKGG